MKSSSILAVLFAVAAPPSEIEHQQAKLSGWCWIDRLIVRKRNLHDLLKSIEELQDQLSQITEPIHVAQGKSDVDRISDEADDSIPASFFREHRRPNGRYKFLVTRFLSDEEEKDDQTIRHVCSFGLLELFPERKNCRNTVILDSGATMHITGNFNLLSKFARTEDFLYSARDGAQLHVAGIGAIASDKLQIRNVRYVPDLGVESPTIISVQQLAGSGYLVMFCRGCCYVREQSNGSLIGMGRMNKHDGLYHLEYLRIPEEEDRGGVVTIATVETTAG